MSLFFKDGLITPSSFLIVLGVAVSFASTGGWKLGAALSAMGFLSALSQAMHEIQEEDKHEIRYRNMSAADISDELEAIENDHDDNTFVDAANENREKCLAALSVLAIKYSEECDRCKEPSQPSPYHPHELETICQEAAYVVLRMYPNDNEAIAAAFALNASVAKDDQVRERHMHEADVFGFNVLIDAMRAALKRAKAIHLEQEERLSAELQRKACLLLGAIANDDSEISTKIVDEGGLQAILEALQWYRFHDDVANWGLWAIFVLCYEHAGNKQEMIRAGGIPVVCTVMKNNSDSLEVSRHGTAVLFDLLRQSRQDSLSTVAQIRKMALNAGLHHVIVSAISRFNTDMQIVMMGQEILVATGYQGEIPRCRPTPS